MAPHSPKEQCIVDPEIFASIQHQGNIHEEIPKELQIQYLSDSSKESDGDINGIVYGLHHQLFCATTVKYKNKIKVVIFLVDTGST
ncbi:hypothetical protein GLOIN_2v1471333 [Rhizophagus irregularis DAOM 181602=DAOM 197198]|uniref:Uncharacterized protein n=1 Tax=Rhizophagus irregularis (strain DAOM 197198w) TaxID=1432141 RepID=A0A015K608_RHIIW|nr:hypothetical protein RirG_026220 [Rhizophagus irregularis DAOM 197198w]GET65361.1 hypothetical protein GLOIN_2v1471333 [Rhizophagus irregularis DAOM 181602=DAOM 197198]